MFAPGNLLFSVVAPAHEACPGGAANRALAIGVLEERSLLGQLIEPWSFICLAAVASKIGVSLIIRKNDYDIGLLGVGYQPE